MKPINIVIPPETIEIENAHRPEKMCYDDFVWCIGATFEFLGASLVIEAPLLGFLRRLLEAILEAMETGVSVHLNDEYGSYQLTIVEQSGEIRVCDAFGGGSVRMPNNELLTGLRRSFEESTSQLESALPQIVKNESYQQLKNEVEGRFRMVARKKTN